MHQLINSNSSIILYKAGSPKLQNPINSHEDLFWLLMHRLLEIDTKGSIQSRSIFQAINHPIGMVTEAAFHWWYRQNLQDGQGLVEPVRVYSRLCNTNEEKYRAGRVILGANAVTLFRVDEKC